MGSQCRSTELNLRLWARAVLALVSDRLADPPPSLFPLPPLAEQAVIVQRVEALMTGCRALEAEIERAHNHAAQLLQAVLKEAFAPAAV